MFLYQIRAKFTKSSHSVMRTLNSKSRSSHSEVFLEKMFWKYAANLKENTHAAVWFRQITLRHGCSPVNLLYIFRTPFLKNTSGWLLLLISSKSYETFCELWDRFTQICSNIATKNCIIDIWVKFAIKVIKFVIRLQFVYCFL